ncbi:MAG: 3-phosphoshikimate 1-carboxyvinyltransferase [Proteobacteria bacterium]|nr:3-phosphoshikimate 1-carboxyvinyltransferase [Pseudomonadota bacterium]
MSHSSPKPMTAHRSGPLAGRVRVPGDQSISHRALILGALATGVTRISGPLEAEDVLHTAKVVEALGARVSRREGGCEVYGRGVGGLVQPLAPLDFGNSGTGCRLMMGAIAGHDLEARLVGDASLSRRPMRRVLGPLRQMGLSVVEDRETLPLTIRGSSSLVAIDYAMPVASAQVKSAVLLAGLSATGETTVIEPEATRDHTERMLSYFGADVRIEVRDGRRSITVAGDAELEGRPIAVPADPSSAAFMAAAAAMVPGSDIMLEGVLVNETRTGFYTTLAEMGADVQMTNVREAGGEPIADVRVRHRSLRGVRVPPARVPSMIDEYPVLAVVAACAEGETRMEGLAELKVKESDRLSATAQGLIANGIDARIDGDTLTVAGSGVKRPRGGGTVVTQMDHRIAMAFLVLGLAAERPVSVDDTGFVATSFPTFGAVMAGLGATFEAG